MQLSCDFLKAGKYLSVVTTHYHNCLKCQIIKISGMDFVVEEAFLLEVCYLTSIPVNFSRGQECYASQCKAVKSQFSEF